MQIKVKLRSDSDDAGIYLIFNRRNDYRYVGMTSCFRLRWHSHMVDLSRGTHSNSLLQYDYNLYGPDVFEFKILEKVVPSSKQHLCDRERVWMARFDAHGPLGYNLAR